jgi:hypothetical protein
MFGGVFRASTTLPVADNDLTGAAPLPMFPAATAHRDTVKTAKKANKSLG